MAAPGMGVSTPVNAAGVLGLEEVINNPERLRVPFEHVSLKEVHKGQSGKLVILIEDAHANYGGQMSLAGALDQLMSD
ncbi:MAG: hypothetical protein HQL11_06215, partial [Candidatus Omnitrophica bacterium]|nr:hypothetical protein [Candidatus Omnitrophota bacterium]